MSPAPRPPSQTKGGIKRRKDKNKKKRLNNTHSTCTTSAFGPLHPHLRNALHNPIIFHSHVRRPRVHLSRRLIVPPEYRVEHAVRRVLFPYVQTPHRSTRSRWWVDARVVNTGHCVTLRRQRRTRVGHCNVLDESRGSVFVNVELLQRRNRAFHWRREFLRVEPRLHVRHDCDETPQKPPCALVVRVFAHDAEQKRAAQATMYRGPGLSCVRRDVLQAQESIHGADETVDARLLESLGQLVTRRAGADGWSTQLRQDIRSMEVKSPVLQRLGDGSALPRVAQVIRSLSHDGLDFVPVAGNPSKKLPWIHRLCSVAHNFKSYPANLVHC